MQMALRAVIGDGTIRRVILPPGQRRRRRPRAERDRIPDRQIAVLLAVDAMLMGFALAAVLLAQPALAALSGTAGVGLAKKIAYLFLR
jgi:hypothetical protein